MAFQSIGQAVVPSQLTSVTNTPLLLDASGEKVAFILRAGKAGDIRKIHFRLATVTTGQTLKASLQNVGAATGDPDETIDQSGTVAVVDTDDNSWKTATLSADRTVSRNDQYAVVIEFDSTIGNLNIATGTQMIYGTHYCDHKTGGTWAKQSRAPLVAIEYADGSFDVMPGVNASILGVADFNTGSTPDEAGNKVTFPAPVKLRGVSFLGRLGGDLDVVVYDSDGSSVLATSSLDADARQGSDILFYAMFASDVQLNANTAYRVVLKPTTATSVRRHDMSYPASAAIAQDELGVSYSKTSRSDAGAWTDDATQRVAMQLFISQIDDAVSAGGMIRSRVQLGM